MLDAKSTKTSTKPDKQQLSSAYLDATGWYNGAHPARLYHDVSGEAAGWANQIEIWFDLERERFWTDCFLYSV